MKRVFTRSLCLLGLLSSAVFAGGYEDGLRSFYESEKPPKMMLTTEEGVSADIFVELKVPSLLGILKYELAKGSWPKLSSSQRRDLLKAVDDPGLNLVYTGKQSSMVVSVGGQVTGKSKILINQDGWFQAGAPRSHYEVAKIVLHELGHVYQVRYNWLPRPGSSKEWFPDELEAQLSAAAFSREAVDAMSKILSGKPDGPCPDISGSWSGELRVSKAEGDTVIDTNQKRVVRGDNFTVTQEGCSVTLKFFNNEIAGQLADGVATLKQKRSGALGEAVLSPAAGRLKVTLKQTTSTGAVIVSDGFLSR